MAPTRGAHLGSHPEPRWQVVLAVLAVGGMSLALPRSMTVVPRGVLLIVVVALLIPTVLARQRGHNRLNEILGTLLSLTITVGLLSALGMLLAGIPKHVESAGSLLRSGAILWATNVLVFAAWYWRLDAGGPNARDLRKAHSDGAFLFPQMTAGASDLSWRPGFVDYLFLAFNTSAAFSPTDTPVLSRWAKLLGMLQSTISLTIVAVLFGRAVNIF